MAKKQKHYLEISLEPEKKNRKEKKVIQCIQLDRQYTIQMSNADIIVQLNYVDK